MTTDVLNAAWRVLPTVLLQLIHEYTPPGPEQGPQAPHIVICCYRSFFGDHVLKSQRTYDGITTNPGMEIVRCSPKDYPAKWKRVKRRIANHVVNTHVYHERCCCFTRYHWTHNS